MNIVPVSGNNYVGTQQNTNSTEKLLEKQKTQLQEQLKTVKESKMDSKLKQVKITELHEQIAEIDRQIRQIKMEKIKPDKTQTARTDISEINYESGGAKGEKAGSSNGINSKHMLSATSGYSDLKIMGKVRTELLGQLRSATSSGENPEAGKGIQEKLDNLEGNMLKKEKEINSDLKKAAKETVKQEKQETEKTEKTEKTNSGSEGVKEALQGEAETIQHKNIDESANNQPGSGDQSYSENRTEDEEEALPAGSIVDVRV